MGSPRRMATPPTASVPTRATAIHKRTEKNFFISVEHCGESSARAQSRFLVQSFLVQSCQRMQIRRFNGNLLFPNDWGPAFGTCPRSPCGRGAFEASGSNFLHLG